MARNSARAKNRAVQRRAASKTSQAVIPVTVQSTSANGDTIGMAEIPVAVRGSSDGTPESVVGKAEIPVAINAKTSGKGRRGKRSASAQHGLTVIPVAMSRRRTKNRKPVQSKEGKPLPPLPPMRHPLVEARDPFLRSLNVAIDVEETAVNIVGSFALAAIGAFETAARLVLRAPAAINRAREIGEEVIPWSLNEIEETFDEWPEIRFAA